MTTQSPLGLLFLSLGTRHIFLEACGPSPTLPLSSLCPPWEPIALEKHVFLALQKSLGCSSSLRARSLLWVSGPHQPQILGGHPECWVSRASPFLLAPPGVVDWAWQGGRPSSRSLEG